MTVFNNGSVNIRPIGDEQAAFVINGHWLKVYHKPLSKKEFIRNMSQQSELELVGEEMTSSSPTFLQWHPIKMFLCIYVQEFCYQ